MLFELGLKVALGVEQNEVDVVLLRDGLGRLPHAGVERVAYVTDGEANPVLSGLGRSREAKGKAHSHRDGRCHEQHSAHSGKHSLLRSLFSILRPPACGTAARMRFLHARSLCGASSISSSNIINQSRTACNCGRNCLSNALRRAGLATKFANFTNNSSGDGAFDR